MKERKEEEREEGRKEKGGGSLSHERPRGIHIRPERRNLERTSALGQAATGMAETGMLDKAETI